MIVPVCSETGQVVEWGLVELQGKTEHKSGLPQEEALHIGTIALSATNKDVVQLTIGYHQLEGKKLPLKKPLAILEKDESRATPGSTAYKVVGVIRNKYLFKTRPRPLITKPHSSR